MMDYAMTMALSSDQSAQVRLSHVWRDFCNRLAEAGEILDRPAAPGSAIDQAEGLRYLSRLTRTALNMLVDSSDPDFPRIFLLTDETIKIGADNPDNLYQQIVVRGDREYRIRGKRGTVPYLSIGSKANRYAIDGTMASTGEIEFANVTLEGDGSFEIIVSKEKKPGNWLPIGDDTTLLIVRQTFNDKKAETPAEMHIERISKGRDVSALLTPEAIEAQLSGAAAWLRGTANTFADWSEWFKTEPNRIYEGKDQSVYQRAGGDPRIWYGHIYFDLQPGEALVITATPPECRMWNFQIDNWWMESMDHVNRKVWVNGSQAKYEEDGSVVLVCSDTDPSYGNWIDLSGHRQGTGLWRWIGASSHPVPDCKVVTL
ncbi:hypothetical protein L288_17180 [Sphingobium quisquiliarum P25]|uniref:DUF1214 domain-containing protein n=1 Tax=Sphingobium quisquiliarum P25 TaxID=1329909 RepID=T0HWM6_9SPHN|nr:DUF1214 domain-containing protein [Sphingobium quisquiliarum]EQB01954.1 hypothetical protein L288_17180 [Sphingobium quisquiliarum P25]